MVSIKKMIDAFRCSPISRVSSVPLSQDDSDLIARRVVSQVSDGNISLQRGRYITQEEIDERRKVVCSYIYAK